MSARVKSLLEHMLEDAQDITTFYKEAGSFEAFSCDVKTQKAIVMSLLNIGELANHLPEQYREANPGIPWRRMIGMRNLAAHGYHTMSLNIIWETAQVFIPELVGFLKSQLPEVENPPSGDE
jgi:uncharacterized protein with HEPN domain